MTGPAEKRSAENAWAKLRHRKVVQWALAYLAGAWGFLQGLEYLSETYGWPQQLRMLAIPALLLGLPVVVVVAWYHGDRGHQRVTRTEFVILALLVVLGGGIVWRYHEAIEARGPSSARSDAASGPAADALRSDDPRPSVAVLPFENRSADADDAYFADAIQDDILTQLTKIPSLRVIASTSVEQLRGSTLSTQEIGERLGVSKLLQGRVQRAGDRVRINVALVDAATGSQDWAERYDRSLTGANILAIQSGVAATVAARLKAGLPAETDANRAASEAAARNIEAWDAYHRGEKARTPEEAEQYYRRAIQADPKFAQAYVGLSAVLKRQIYDRGARRDVMLPEAEAAAETALQLDPAMSEAWLASAEFFGNRGEWEVEEARIRKAIELNPNLAGAYERLSDLLLERGRAEEAVPYAKKGVALDPLSSGLRVSLAQALEVTGNLDEAETQYRRAVEIDPTAPWPLQALAEFQAYVRGRFVIAVPLMQKAVRLDPDNAFQVGQLAMLYLDLEDDARAAELLDDALSRWPDRTNVNMAAMLLAQYRGDQLSAARYAAKALETSPRHPGALTFLAQADIARGDPAAGRARFTLAYPDMMAPVPGKVTRDTIFPALGAASILLASGDRARARVLLDRSEQVVRTKLRPDVWTDINLMHIAVLRGDKAGAVRALREAVKAGWRGPFWRVQLLFDINVVPLHGDPGFEAAVAEIRADMARQRAELSEMNQDAAGAR